MRIFTELLFQHGHIADAALAQRLAEPDAALEPVEQVKPRESIATSAQDPQTAGDTTQQTRASGAWRG
ncbi:hypothetical protein KWM_0121580 [Xanthomonas vasicola pv. musacearum NCPPB 2005]|uniref:Uncharacterized protein n=1 Tax=Xanthomonas vasicola pv. vasculorum NCPPB 890 TaxID=1184265 RepID=A0A836ZTY4_XANVA|nr:hypothetical protein A11M_0125605 [Xanthomonas vasicola pv. vasculorum NCPPB 895]KFA04119.1 hypothetical protein KWM_0121580 [Xanthomonas vasicola pv. musacearum NCPPB 2005]KFA08198.1 hypothetical protein KWQ_0114825 [Xanthomonas vasicola pv. musacearum NCPPB 4380]KFA15513.1 hypothetical protein A11G_0121080 [Xanthomonas vasicola pv. musacearum NCPPB 4392]KFA22311.1 hypothetical protein KW5_0124040 [Xanthomonas vasicola pv. vasculorum NCPPB 1326]KFA24939.1 hypothetical protein KWU_0104040 [